ncbi:restriction modification system DNA specificity domain (plasmid) [Herpetosiphon aurantiacus DSM 785]|uniref:Restriction modification system DNA specificity domain n=1 Tax=Herpetosiphon aurantiacus (strain ATCC 23779 / DSM 785 / 114-95) TaxID=316274 RepID=A9B989_HERA2|nr:restriction modification system DNA specificity domain [Herpetosiphon aurantiacus DSM 785]
MKIEDTTTSSIWDLPSHWGVKKLKLIAKEISQQIKPADNPSTVYNYWGLDAITKGQFQEPKQNLVKGSNIESTCVTFTENQIIYSKLRPYLNKVIVPSIPGIGTTEWIVVEPDANVVDRKYLAYVLRSPAFLRYVSRGENINGARMPRLRKDSFWNFPIPLPSLSNPARSLQIQQSIVVRIESLLSELGEIRELHRRIDLDVSNVMDSIFRDVYIDLENKYPSRQRIDSFTQVKTGGTPSRKHSEYYNGDIPWVKTGELKDGLIKKTEEYITLEAMQNSNAKKIPIGTLLVAMYGQGQTRGRTGLLAIEATTNQACCAILPNPYIFIPRYLQFWFIFMYHDLRKKSDARGGNQANLNSQIIKELKPPLPPIFVQQQVVSYLDAAYNELIDMQSIQSINKLLFDQIEQSILEQAFRGEL